MAYRVLVVDDDVQVRESIVSLLTHDGFATHSVGEAGIAFNLISQALQRKPSVSIDARIDFVVLDYNLPDYTGLEVLTRIRAQFEYRIPAVLVTGNYSHELEAAVLAQGGFAVMPKPVQPQFFRQTIQKLVQSYFSA